MLLPKESKGSNLTMTTAELIIHLGSADGEVVWWAESPDAPGFTAAAPSLAELRQLAVVALQDLLTPQVEIVERLEGGDVHRSDEGWDARVVTAQAVPC
ncbi:MAG TPA: hypothetical protein VK611_13165 [Acidimicrobiales bacterium]|nr:hypothetical protein [Acidimicrobiales bacterium]